MYNGKKDKSTKDKKEDEEAFKEALRECKITWSSKLGNKSWSMKGLTYQESTLP